MAQLRRNSTRVLEWRRKKFQDGIKATGMSMEQLSFLRNSKIIYGQ